MLIINAQTTKYRVHVVPAFSVDAEEDTEENGFLLNHGIFNYNGLRSEEAPSRSLQRTFMG